MQQSGVRVFGQVTHRHGVDAVDAASQGEILDHNVNYANIFGKSSLSNAFSLHYISEPPEHAEILSSRASDIETWRTEGSVSIGEKPGAVALEIVAGSHMRGPDATEATKAMKTTIGTPTNSGEGQTLVSHRIAVACKVIGKYG